MTIRRGVTPMKRSFTADRVKTVILRAAEADHVEVVIIPGGRSIEVVGLPEGNELGYHPADPTQERVGSPYGVGLDFVARPCGATLVVSSAHEARYIHHEWHLVQLRLQVPAGVTVIKQAWAIPSETPADNSHLEAP